MGRGESQVKRYACITIQIKANGTQWTNLTSGIPSLGIFDYVWTPTSCGSYLVRSLYSGNPFYSNSSSSTEILTLTIPGDFDSDFVDIYDVVIISGAYGSTPSDHNWNSYCDLAEPHGIIDIYDGVLMA